MIGPKIDIGLKSIDRKSYDYNSNIVIVISEPYCVTQNEGTQLLYCKRR